MDSFHNRVQYNFFLILLGLTAVVVFFMVRPLLAPLILAVSLGVLFMPMHRRIIRACGGYRTIASLISLVIVIAVVIIPLGIISLLVFREAVTLYAQVSTGHLTSLNLMVSGLNVHLDKLAPGLKIDPSAYIVSSLSWVVSNFGVLFSEVFKILLETFLLILTLFYIFMSGESFYKKIIDVNPLSEEYNNKIFKQLGNTVVSVLRGSLIIAVIQGLAAGFGTALFGLPSPVIWGVCAAAASFVPGVGTLLVMGPAIVSRLAFGSLGSGIGLLVWYICTLILVDNILSPYVIERGTKIHSLFILISVLGGLVVFGPIGFIVGPIFLAFFFALLEIYPDLAKK